MKSTESLDQLALDNSTTGSTVKLVRSIVRVMISIERTLAVLMFCVVIVTMGAHVVARDLFHRPFGWSEELAKFGLIWMSFLSAAFVMAEGKHISVDVLSSRLTMQASNRLHVISYLVVIAVSLVMLIGGLNFVWYVKPVGSPMLGISKALWYLATSTGLLLMAVHAAANLFLMLRTGHPYDPNQDHHQIEVDSVPATESNIQASTAGDAR